VRLSGSLYIRLGLVLAMLFALVAVAFVAILVYVGNSYLDEGAQRANRALAATIAKEHTPIGAGTLDLTALRELFRYVAVVNPTVDAYVLDPAGRVLAQSADNRPLLRQAVDLAPIQAILAGREPLPILGDDPHSARGRRVFSVAPIQAAGQPRGYVYVLLSGGPLSGMQMWSQSTIMKLAIAFCVAAFFFATAAGLLLFRSLTARLTRLTRAVEDFKERRFAEPVAMPRLNAAPRDEIDRLGTVFAEMSGRMVDQLQRLEAVDQLRRRSIANASHDLRTPLAALQGYLETLLLKSDSLAPDVQRQYMQTAHKHGKRLEALVNEMFELARLDAPEAAVHAETFPLDELVADVAQQHRLRAQERGIALKAEIARGVFVKADVGMLERVFENLIENALRHTPAGGEVVLYLEKADGQAVLGVRDNGEGIAPERLPYVFDRFYGGGPGGGSAGLGLAIVKRILELHDSAIDVSSTPGAGTRFSFRLVLAH
jgi:two-component system OmpR family sensor kinase